MKIKPIYCTFCGVKLTAADIKRRENNGHICSYVIICGSCGNSVLMAIEEAG